MELIEKKILASQRLTKIAEKLRSEKKTVVSSNGCFDILHWGHLRYLNEARKLGDVLVVGINSDASVKRLKGPTRPIFPQDIRAKQLASLAAVDYVVIFEEDTPNKFLTLLRPQIHAKGADYENRELPERAVVEGFGGRIELLALEPGFSTTNLIAKLKALTN